MGLHPAIADGVVEAHDGGILSACSFVAAGPDLGRSVGLVRSRPRLEPGLHLVLAGAPLVSAAKDVPSLAPHGRPLPHWRAFVARYALGRIDPRDVEREFRAQADTLLRAGLRLTHVNAHLHLHVLPGIARVVARLASELGLAYVRIPAAPWREVAVRPARLALRLASLRARSEFRQRGLAMNDVAVAVAVPGHLGPASLRTSLDALVAVGEVVAHVGVGNGDLDRVFRTGYDWDGERLTLTDPGLRGELARRGIRLVRPSEVPRLRA